MSGELAKLLSTLKKRDEMFQQERDEMRTDFLLRGICEAEVDGLLDDPSLFPTLWLPETLRWEAFIEAGDLLPSLLKEAIAFLEWPYLEHIDIAEAIAFIQSKK
ncbi:hypothetical protein KHA96_11470 [Bacillus sp. FJAT-49711]|uniref:hypothetical protein n=1 Tax=Bacillus sp. FJAT-49711 TaxID=2833585 RepID=UPI001BC9F502|nr:hypothetical protein [Bacillus sp. FJAT-49711]MBS4218934.1 hypothetical protein [Bacillus sp. FJAT-49711]